MPMPLSEKKKKADHKKEPNNHSGNMAQILVHLVFYSLECIVGSLGLL